MAKGDDYMLVKTGDILYRGGKWYQVIIADDNVFVLGKVKHHKKGNFNTVSYMNCEIYANQACINTLEELNFTRLEKE
jgi:hypothetical protein